MFFIHLGKMEPINFQKEDLFDLQKMSVWQALMAQKGSDNLALQKVVTQV